MYFFFISNINIKKNNITTETIFGNRIKIDNDEQIDKKIRYFIKLVFLYLINKYTCKHIKKLVITVGENSFCQPLPTNKIENANIVILFFVPVSVV